MAANASSRGRIAGFTMGTGSTLSLLPAQNATGNFVKVVQRLPVRIELVGYDAEKSPLFIGTSVVPEVHSTSRPPDRMPGSFFRLACHRPRVRRQARPVPGSDDTGGIQLSGSGQPLGGRC